MTPPDAMAITRIGVVGAGTMGSGIAQTAAQAGLRVCLFDQRPEAAAAAKAAIATALERQVAKGRLGASDRDAVLGRLECVDTLAALAACDLVIEAIAEDLAAKCALFRRLEELLPAHAVLASNTSSLSITAIAAGCRSPARVVGWHFFNPVPQVRIAEVVAGLHTPAALAQRLMALTRRLGHAAVLAEDVPGFIVNHAGRAFIPEGLRLLNEGIAGIEDIDAVVRDVAGFRMGPFQLADLIGLDNGLAVMESLYHQHQQEPRFRITPLLARMVAAGQLGRKSGRGFYRYGAGQEPAAAAVAAAPAGAGGDLAALRVWIAPHEHDLAQAVQALLQPTGVRIDDAAGPPSAEALIIVTPVGPDVSGSCHTHGYDVRRTVGVDALFGLARRCSVMAAPGFDAARRAQASALFGATGMPVTWLRDSPGFVAQRLVAQIVSIGCDMAQQRIATPADIDAAVTLALGYPFGPFAFGDRLGPRRILQIGEALFESYKDPRYRPSLWLRRRALAGLPLATLD